jgi:Rieske Fe-S protein
LKTNKHISRKTFIRTILALLALPFIFLLNSMVERSKKYGLAKRTKEISSDLAVGVSFFDEVIVVKESTGQIQMFSSKCPHLGCQINKYVDGKITCPCHGSTFRKDGSIIKGPAAHALTTLHFEKNGNGNYIVDLS